MTNLSAFLEFVKIGYACSFEVVDYYDRRFNLEIECDTLLPEKAYEFYARFVEMLPVKELSAGEVRPIYKEVTLK